MGEVGRHYSARANTKFVWRRVSRDHAVRVAERGLDLEAHAGNSVALGHTLTGLDAGQRILGGPCRRLFSAVTTGYYGRLTMSI